jgi:hypothetical protein
MKRKSFRIIPCFMPTMLVNQAIITIIKDCRAFLLCAFKEERNGHLGRKEINLK